jgi:hypothetical protein
MVGSGPETEELTALREGVGAFEDHSYDGAREHESDQAGEETLRLEVLVMLLHVLAGRLSHLESDELETLLLESKSVKKAN